MPTAWKALRQIHNNKAGCGGDPFRFHHKELWEAQLSGKGAISGGVVLVNASSAEIVQECLAKKYPDIEMEINRFDYRRSFKRVLYRSYAATHLTFPDNNGNYGGCVSYEGLPVEIAEDILKEEERQQGLFEIRPGNLGSCRFG